MRQKCKMSFLFDVTVIDGKIYFQGLRKRPAQEKAFRRVGWHRDIRSGGKNIRQELSLKSQRK